MYLKIGIFDDEAVYIEQAKDIISDALRKRNLKYHIYTFQSMKEYEAFIKQANIEPDILFLDIDLKTYTGIDIAKEINHTFPWCQIIFLTNYLQYATDIFTTEHCYFILKDELEERIFDVLDKVMKELAFIQNKKLVLFLRGKKEIVNQKDILYIERVKRTSVVHLKEDTIEVGDKLNDLEGKLEKGNFVRCHASFIVNLNYVKEFLRDDFILYDGTLIPISRKYYEDTKEQFTFWIGEEKIL